MFEAKYSDSRQLVTGKDMYMNTQLIWVVHSKACTLGQGPDCIIRKVPNFRFGTGVATMQLRDYVGCNMI